MDLSLDAIAKLPRYRFVSLLLLFSAIAIEQAFRTLKEIEWLGTFVAMGVYCFLIVTTYRRLRDASRSGAWVWLMIFNFSFGPSWNDFYLSNLINLIPMFLGWIVPGSVDKISSRI